MASPAEVSGTPSSHSRVSTRRVLYFSWTRGVRIVAVAPDSAAPAVTAAMLPASVRKSSSSWSEAAKPLISSHRPRLCAHAVCSSSLRPIRSRMSRSRSTTGPAPGRWTFTAISWPFASRARWTCAIDPAASGSRSNEANTVSGSRPSSSVSASRTRSHGSGAAWWCSRENSSTYSAGSRS
ncbi:hypothetical protein ACVWXU_004575 [Streptomyces sp. TE33382]